MRERGNQCIYWMFWIANILLALVGIAIVASGIYLFVLTKEPNVFNLSLLGTGLGVLIMAGFSFCLRDSKWRLKLYNIILFVLSAVMLLTTFIFLIVRGTVIKWIVEAAGTSGPEIEKRAN